MEARSRTSHLIRALALIGSAHAAFPAMAQQAADEPVVADVEPRTPGQEDGDIVVTARYREERLQDVPLSIVAFDAKALEDRGATGFADYARSVPNLNFTSRGANRLQFVIRGISPIVGEASVGYYLDGIGVSNANNNPDFGLFDIASVEILRGPQGTLYGEGALGGAIKVTTTKPDATRYEGKAQATVSQTRDGGTGYGANALVNIPLAKDRLALRVSGFWRHDAGWIDNLLDGRRNINDVDSRGVRAALRFTPTDNLSLEAIVNHQADNVGNLDVRTVLPPALFGLPVDTHVRRYDVILATDNIERQKNTQYTLLATWQTGAGTLESVVGYNREKDFRVIDSLTASGLGPGLPADFSSDNRTFTTEHRFISDLGGPFDFAAGILYRDRSRNNVLNADVSALFGAPPPLFYNIEIDFENRSFALFGEAYYNIGKLRLTAGLRWTRERVSNPGQVTVGGVPDAPTYGTSLYKATTPKFGISWQAGDDLLLFANAAKGFRVGGANIQSVVSSPDFPPTYSPDSAWSYEAGFKSQFLDRRLTLNASLFHIDWRDVQVLLPPDPVSGNPPIGNAGKAHSTGLEVEVNARPADVLTLSAGVGYVDARFDETVGAILKDTRQPNAPEWTVNAAAELRVPVGSGWNLFGRTDWSYRTETDSANPANIFAADPALGLSSPIRVSFVPAYTIGNLRAGIESDRYALTVFINNVTNDLAITSGSDSGQYIGRPRTIGASLRAQF